MLRRSFLLGAIGSLAASGVAKAGFWTFPTGPNLNTTFDLVVYGGTIAGINAAYTAASNGLHVCLCEPTPYLGGMSGAGGLANIDIWQTNTTDGIFWQEFQQMAVAEGTQTTGNGGTWPASNPASTNAASIGFLNTTAPGQLTPQPKTVASVLNRIAYGNLNPPGFGGITVLLNSGLQTSAGVVWPAVQMSSGAANASISSIFTTYGPIKGTVFIDASYEGDVMAAVARNTGGTSYAVGRESTAAYSEAHAGVSPGAPTAFSGSPSLVDGGGNPLFPLIANPGFTTGAADGNVQNMCVRATIITIANGGVAFTQPAGYSNANYTLVGSVLTAGSKTLITDAVTLNTLMGNKYCMNDVSGGLPFTMVNKCKGYGDGTPTQRAAIVAAVNAYYKGLLWYLQTDSGVPSAVRTNTALYGLCRDEFTQNSGWPYQVYVREGRRMVNASCDIGAGGVNVQGAVGAAQVMTEAGITNGSTATHSIGMTNYVMDCHTPMAYVSDSTHYVLDGALFITTGFGANCQIPMECIIPASGGCPNLIVPVCCGATHVAWTSMRVEPTLAIMGEAAGLMAYRVAKGGDANVQSINYGALTTLLTAIGAKLS